MERNRIEYSRQFKVDFLEAVNAVAVYWLLVLLFVMVKVGKLEGAKKVVCVVRGNILVF